MSNKQYSTPTVEQLQRTIRRQRSTIARLTAERDEARAKVVEQHISWIYARNSFYAYRHNSLPSDAIASIRRGNLTMEQAIAERNERWPVFRFEEGRTLPLADAYQLAT